QRPDLKIVLEGHEPAVVRYGWPEHTPAFEGGHGLGRCVRPDRLDPNVLRAVSIGYKVEGFAVGGPHRPHFTCSAIGKCFVSGFVAVADKPDLGLIEMTVPLAPPLAGCDRPRGNRKCRTVRRGSGEKLVGITVAGYFHWGAAVRADAEDVIQARDVMAGG